MAEVKSKNLYELLGNDHEEDSDKEPEPPTKAIDKPAARTGKRTGPEVAPAKAAGTGGGQRGRGGFSGNEGAYRDRNVGRDSNRDKPIDDSVRDDRHSRRGGGARRGGRGATFKEGRDDRRSHGRPNEHAKQADASWGGATGGDEWEDERAGEAIAQTDAKDPAALKGPDAPTDGDGNTLTDAPAAEPEPEDNSKSYADYLAEQAAKKLNLSADALKPRQANEGTKENKKWAGAKELSKDEEEDAYIAAKEAKAGRQRQRKQKETVDIDHRFQEAPRGDRGGRGGGRGRGEFRGRGEGRGRGARGGGDRGDFRGGRGGQRGGAGVNISDSSAFPSLGGS